MLPPQLEVKTALTQHSERSQRVQLASFSQALPCGEPGWLDRRWGWVWSPSSWGCPWKVPPESQTFQDPEQLPLTASRESSDPASLLARLRAERDSEMGFPHLHPSQLLI